MNKRARLIILFLILIIAGFLRLYKLTELPPGLWIDEAANGNNALTALKTSPPADGFQVFYPENNGREGLFINLQAISVAIFGNEPWTLRLVSTIFGILTVFGIYLLTRALFSNEHQPQIQNSKIKSQNDNSKFKNLFGIWDLGFGASRRDTLALLASFFVATSFWHINFSRIGFRAISAPFFLIFGFYFLLKAFRAIKTNSKFYILNSIFAGLFFGLGFHTYIAYRILPLLLAVVLWLQWKNIPQEHKKAFVISIFYFLISIFLAALPLGLYFLDHPQNFFGRAAEVSILKRPVQESLLNVVKTLGMFNVVGDWNWRHNYAGRPILNPVVGLFFIIGVVVSIRRFYRSQKNLEYGICLPAEGRLRRPQAGNLGFGLPLAWLTIMLIPNLLSPQGTPHALRALVTLPAIFILAAIGGEGFFSFLFETKTQQWTKFRNALFPPLIIVTLIYIFLSGYNGYFIQWAYRPEIREAFSANYLEQGLFLRELKTDYPKYIIMNIGGVDIHGFPASLQTIFFITGGQDAGVWQEKNMHFIKEEEFLAQTFSAPAIFIPLQEDPEINDYISAKYQNAIPLVFKLFTAWRI